MDLLAQAKSGFQSVPADASLKEQALKYLSLWLTGPEFVGYKPQLEGLIRTEQWAGLLDRFYQILPFGTGGRRGPVGVGPNRMNPWTLGASVQGHCEYLKQQFPGIEPLRVVLAYDVRQFKDKNKRYQADLPNPIMNLSSKDFAHQAALIYIANGLHVWLLPPESPRYFATPELSYIIRMQRAHGGLNISASHNPPDDNGGKFYDDRGGQPVAPEDQIMADLVEQVTTIKTIPWADAVKSGRLHFLDESAHQAYIDLCRKQSLVPAPKSHEIKVVFTPLHGVGSNTAMETLVAQGFRVLPVESQMQPDGQFPNVTQTPNPEVPASMDRAVEVGKQHQADLILATDPDADRLGAMVPDRVGGWRFVTGNEIAALLTHFKLQRLSLQGLLPRSPIVITTLVTTSLITRIAEHFKAQIVNNLLVGFKYHADVIWHLEQEGAYEEVRGTPDDFVIATEESHGILVTPKIRDKDAGGAALLFAELALDQKRQGRTVLDALEGMYKQFGYFHNQGVQIVMTGIEGKQKMARMLDSLRTNPPQEIAGLKVTGFEDLRDEQGRMGPLKGSTDTAARNFLIFQLGDKARICLRPSGTEPKAKSYIEVCSDPCPAGLSAQAWQASCDQVDTLGKQLASEFQTLSQQRA